MTVDTNNVQVIQEETELDNGLVIWNSIQKTGSPKNSQKIRSRYLRASIGSCHDLCKYGHKDPFEAEAKSVTPRSGAAISGSGQSLRKALSLAERKKKWVTSLELSNDSKTPKPDNSVTVKRKFLSPTKKVNISPKKVQSSVKEIDDCEENASNLNLKPLLYKSYSLPTKGSMSKARNLEKYTGALLLNSHGGSGIKRSTLSENKVSEQSGNENGIHTINTYLLSRNRKVEGTKRRIHSRTATVSSEKRKQKNTRTGSQTTRSSFSSLSPSSSSMSLSKSLHSEKTGESSENVGKENTKTKSKRWLRKGGVVSQKEKDPPARKLKFRKGKGIVIQPETSTPRRLKFRQGRVIVENQSGKADVGRRIFIKRGVNHGDQNGKKSESVKVVLKHQEVKGKKELQSLFNNVIEETATELVKTRKSKVKALVGAFESVISLQDKKPAGEPNSACESVISLQDKKPAGEPNSACESVISLQDKKPEGEPNTAFESAISLQDKEPSGEPNGAE